MTNPLEKLINHPNDFALLWEGNDGWLIKTKKHLIACDLDLYNIERIHECKLDTNLLCEKLQLLMITHEHEDHFNSATCKILNEYSNCTFIIPKSCEKKAKDLGLEKCRTIFVEPKDRFSYDDIKIECVRAVHGHIGQTVYSGANMCDCGYLITAENQTIYQPGDTILLEEHLNMPKVDILFVSPTDHNTKVENSLKMIRSINPRYIFPQHHSTYYENEDNIFWTHGFVDELYDALSETEKKKFIQLHHNGIWPNRD